MYADLALSPLLAQATQAAIPERAEFWASVLTSVSWLVIVAAVFILPFLVGSWLARALRAPDYRWKLGLILFSVALATLALVPKYRVSVKPLPDEDYTYQLVLNEDAIQWPPKLGIDLKGGVILIYEIDPEARQPTARPAEGQEDEGAEDAPRTAEEDEVDDPTDDINMNDLVSALSRRLNPGGTREILIRPYGDRQVEIIIPDVDEVEIEQAKRLITSSGFLEFRIVANQVDHQYILDQARQQTADPVMRRSNLVYEEDDDDPQTERRAIGFWAQAGREDQAVRGIRPLKQVVNLGDAQRHRDAVRDAETGRWIVPSPTPLLDDEIVVPSGVDDLGRDPEERTYAFERWLNRQGIEEIQILMAIDDPYNITGAHLGNPSSGTDSIGRPAVHFSMKGRGPLLMGNITKENLPDPETGFKRQLGILMDDQLLSAPSINSRITDSGIIEGNFTLEEVDFLVGILRAGRLPAVLNENPLSENKIGAILGADTIRKGSYSMVVSMVLVLAFMLLYYRFSGIVACIALLANLLLIVALMVLISATLTLPGLAGLVLTVGMSVDANVLIYERIREELNRGAALRMAIRNGFARATTTIVDANVTTLITAVVLYVIGTDQIRGFAVTLILGILMSMFTAIFWARVIFDIAERRRWITRLNMMQLLGATQIDFMGWWKSAGIASVLMIALGIGAMAVRQEQIFDIDFLGGTSVHVQLKEPLPVADLRERLEEAFEDVTVERERAQYTLTRLEVADQPPDTMYKIDSSILEVEDLQEVVREALVDEQGRTLLATYSLETEVLQDEPAADDTGATPSPAAQRQQSRVIPRRSDLPPTSLVAVAPQAPLLLAQAEEQPVAEDAAEEEPEQPAAEQPAQPSADEQPVSAEQQPTEQQPATQPAVQQPASPTEEPSTSPATAPTQRPDDQQALNPVRTRVMLRFDEQIREQALREELEGAAEALEAPLSDIQILTAENEDGVQQWTVSLGTDEYNASRMLNQLEQKFDDMPVWRASSKIGGQVAGDTKAKAIAALLASLVGIVAYLWIRFQRVMYGLAAVAALIHDVVITIGAIAASYWLADALGFLMIEEFKISLSVVAALMTVIGYSLNDTIVVFDRIREVRGKSPQLNGAMINVSVNQTLSRTLLTSGTTLLVVVVLYIMGGQGIHGFAFTLLVGVVVGTYSTVFIASPILLWMSQGRKQEQLSAAPAKSLSA